ncbi:MAG: hypothetical protein KUG77_24540 [Nannocystaceae bacterium]|nr:hypothetical protein [Nannocystaceae bacterium]
MLVAASFALTVGLTIGLIALLMTGMAVGVIVSNRRLAGSCGGADADCVCEKKERGECPHEGAEPLPPGERLVSPNLHRAV